MRTRAEIRDDLNHNEDRMQALRASRNSLLEELKQLEASESIIKVGDEVWISLSRYVKHHYVIQWHKAIVLALGHVAEGKDRPEHIRVRRYKANGGLAVNTLQTRNWKTDAEYQDEALRNVTVP